jgi:recombination protein RecT
MSNIQKKEMKDYFASEVVRKKFEEVIGKNTNAFMASLLQIVNGSKYLQDADPGTVMNAAMMSAVLQLPIHPSLGYAYIVPYKGEAQFQIGWKGLVQLAQRSGQYLEINVVEVYKNQFISFNALTEELQGDFNVDGQGEIVGYCAYFKLANGFRKVTYWSKEKVLQHAKKYSQAYRSDKGITPWKDKDQFHEMAKKTVLKNTLTKWGPMSIDMQKAVTIDQAVIEDLNGDKIKYPDNQIQEHGEKERFQMMLEADYESLEQFQKDVLDRAGEDIKDEFAFEIQEKIETLKAKAQ